MTQHALLSASSSSRWLACPPSARIAANYPDSTSPYAEEGTRAHALAEKTLKQYLEGGSGDVKSCADANTSEEMVEAVQRYVDICIEKIVAARTASPDAQVLVEQRLDYSDYAPHGFGTGDMIIVSDDSLEVIDLKYGVGVPVSAVENTQMRLYALGAVHEFSMLYDFDTIHMTIVQPRRDSVSSDQLTLDELLAWGESIRPIARMAYDGKGHKQAGPHCRFCPESTVCKTLADYMMRDLSNDDPDKLSDEELARIVLKAKEVKTWLDSVEAYALQQALDGRDWPGLKLVAGRRKRTITDEHAAAMILMDEGQFTADDLYKPQELKTLTSLEKIVGKKKLAELLASVIDVSDGKPTLVAESDKRPALNPSDMFDDSLL